MKEKFYIDAKVKKIDKQIEKAIKKAGITYPHHSLAFFKATYAKFEEPNGNKVILANSVKDDVKYLIGTQMNYNHERYGAIMGSIINAYVTKNNEIEIVFTFAKTVYPKEYELALELMKKDELTVSFELMVDKDDVELVSGGNRKLKKVYFDGVGLLFKVKPAYKNAYVLETAMRIIEDAFKQKDKQLVYASAKDITKKWTRIGELIEKALIEKEEGEAKMDEKAREALLAKFKEAITEELGEEAVKDWSDEQWEAELKKKAEAEDETKSETTEASEGEVEESKNDEESKEETEKVESEDASEEKPEDEIVKTSKEESKEEQNDSNENAKEKETASYDCECLECGKVISSEEHCKDIKCPACGGEMRRKSRPGSGDRTASEEEMAEKFKVEEETKTKTTQEYDSETQEESVKVESETVTKVNDEIKQINKRFEEILYRAKELEKQLEEKSKEITFLKENAKKVVEIRNEYGEFVKDLSDEELFDEAKMEVVALKKENAELKKAKSLETADDKEENDSEEQQAEEKPEDKEDLKTGHSEKEQKSEETAEERISQYLKTKYGNK